MSTLQIYNSTGEILRTINCSISQVDYQCATGESKIEGEGANNTHYILSGVITAKTTNPATIDKTGITADGIDKATISSLHNPSTVFILGNTTVTDGELEITADDACSIIATCSAVPYLDKEFTVIAS